MFKKSVAPAAERNKDPILEILKSVIKVPENKSFPSIRILEIASGTGQHIAHFAKHLDPSIFWQPTEQNSDCFFSIAAFILENQLKNVAPPVYVDVGVPHVKWFPVCIDELKKAIKLDPITSYKVDSFDYIYNSNLMHISSFDCTEGLFYNSGKLLRNGGCLITYGPFAQNGVISPESNVMFDKSLKSADPEWGIRDIQLDLIPLAEKFNLKLIEIIDMPANNKIIIWQKI